jgi:hypothetical protein
VGSLVYLLVIETQESANEPRFCKDLLHTTFRWSGTEEEDISEKPPFSAKGRIKPGKNKVWKSRVVIVVDAVGKWAVYFRPLIHSLLRFLRE